MERSSPTSDDGASLFISGIKSSGSMERLSSGTGLSSLSRITSAVTTTAFTSNNNAGASIRVPTGSSLSSIASSPSGEMLVIGGREILKIFSSDTSEEILNLRMGAKSTINLNSNDVAWGYGSFKNVVASAAASGTIVLFDLNKSEKIGKLSSEF